jgi:hypothetical protein
MLPQPTRDPQKEHFRDINPRVLFMNREGFVWIYPPYHVYDEKLRDIVHKHGLSWDKEQSRWEKKGEYDLMALVEQIYNLGYDVCIEANSPDFQSQWLSVNQGELAYATMDQLWYEHLGDL